MAARCRRAVFGVVHRRIGIAQQLFGLLVVRTGKGDADRCGGENFLGPQSERRLQLDDDAFGDDHRLAVIGNALKQHGKLIATKASDYVAGFQAGADAPADLEK